MRIFSLGVSLGTETYNLGLKTLNSILIFDAEYCLA